MKVMGYRLWVIGVALLLSVAVYAADSTAVTKPSVYQGVTLKLDIATPAIVAGFSKGKIQHYEMALNVRLANRFYPTVELGYAGGRTHKGDSLQYNAHGGFARIGCDINPLKKSAAASPHAMLVGVRVATAVQEKGYTDAWGEVVAGCQVEICKVKQTAFYMGWQGRLKFLFTPDKKNLLAEQMKPIYIPGYGHRKHLAWGLSYHLGWRF